jgi:hypothetical protein
MRGGFGAVRDAREKTVLPSPPRGRGAGGEGRDEQDGGANDKFMGHQSVKIRSNVSSSISRQSP